jgi:hypothetical protein
MTSSLACIIIGHQQLIDTSEQILQKKLSTISKAEYIFRIVGTERISNGRPGRPGLLFYSKEGR